MLVLNKSQIEFVNNLFKVNYRLIDYPLTNRLSYVFFLLLLYTLSYRIKFKVQGRSEKKNESILKTLIINLLAGDEDHLSY